MSDTTLRIVVLISGGGTTLKNLLAKREAGELSVEIPLVISSSSVAGGLKYAEAANIESVVLRRSEFATTEAFSDALFEHCRQAQPDYVVMGGFLKLLRIPPDFENRVINIHPSLIPSFCGKGFYGHYVHEAVLEYGARITGCTVHFVDNQYDHGPIVLQRPVPVGDDDTPDTLAARVFEQECEAYPEALRMLAAGQVSVEGRRVRIKPATQT